MYLFIIKLFLIYILLLQRMQKVFGPHRFIIIRTEPDPDPSINKQKNNKKP